MTGIDSRFLTAKAKCDILAEWEQTRRRWQTGELYGTGAPDADIVPWCEQINELPGICTLQSCAGHNDEGVFQSAHLWLWMSRDVAARFNDNAFVLLGSHNLIDWISRHYLHDGKEIASITFFGNERDLLAKSASLIYRFMCGVANKTT